MRRTLLTMIAAAMLAAGADIAVELESAIRRETVQGDLKGAAEAYRRIAAQAGANREVAARALFRLGLVYRKQGDAQARQTFERLVRDYGDQELVVADARSELARMSNGNGKSMAARLLWKSSMGGGRSIGRVQSISRDGKLVSVLLGSANLGVLDTRSGETRMLTDYGDWDAVRGIVYTTTVSPDGHWVAFNARLKNPNLIKHELRVVRTDGHDPLTLIPSEQRYLVPYDWTADSKRILCRIDTRISQPGEEYKTQAGLYLVSVPSGDKQIVKEDAGIQGARLWLSPDDKWIAYTDSPTQLRLMSIDGRVDQQIADGQVMGWSPDGRHLIFASDVSGSNGIYRIRVNNGRVVGSPELIRLVPSRLEAVGLDAKGTLYYTENDFRTDAYTVGIDLVNARFTGEPQRVTKRYEGRNMAPIWSPDGSKLAWFALKDFMNVSMIVIRDLATGQERDLLMQIPARFRKYPSWQSDGSAFLFAAREPDSTALYRIDASTGAASKIHSDGRITDWSGDGARLYKGTFREDHFVWDSKTGQETKLFHDPSDYQREITVSPDGTKVAYVAHYNAPEGSSDFYGPVYIRIRDLRTGEARDLVKVRPAWYGRMMTWTPDSKYLIYSTEWYAGHSDDPTQVWVVPAAGGEARKIGPEFKGRVFGLRVSPDGRQLAFDVTEHTAELWALENFLPK